MAEMLEDATPVNGSHLGFDMVIGIGWYLMMLDPTTLSHTWAYGSLTLLILWT